VTVVAAPRRVPRASGLCRRGALGLEAIDKLEQERRRLLRQLWDRGAPIPVPPPTAAQRLSAGQHPVSRPAASTRRRWAEDTLATSGRDEGIVVQDRLDVDRRNARVESPIEHRDELRERYWERCTLFDVNFVPKGMSVEELEQGLEYLGGALYTTDEVRRRRLLYLQAIRSSEAAA